MLERVWFVIVRQVARQGALKAAGACFLTQSALSHTVKKIEQQPGTPIWDRAVVGRHCQAAFSRHT